jgi:hypothetical protein
LIVVLGIDEEYIDDLQSEHLIIEQYIYFLFLSLCTSIALNDSHYPKRWLSVKTEEQRQNSDGRGLETLTICLKDFQNKV